MVSPNKTLSKYYEICEFKRNELEHLLAVLKEWTGYEEIYSKGLGSIINKLEKGFLGTNNCFTKALNILMKRSNDFCEVIGREILVKGNEFLSISGKNIKTAYSTGIKAGEKISEKYTKTDNTTALYYKSLVDFESAATSLNINSSKKRSRKMFSRFSKAQKRLAESFEAYRYSQMKYKVSYEKYMKNIELILKILNKFEYKANEEYNNILKSVRESLVLRSVENEESYSELLAQPPKLGDFKITEFHIAEPNIERYMNKRQVSLMSTYSILDPLIRLDMEGIVEKKCTIEFEDILGSAWNGEKPNQDAFNYFIEHISDLTGRKAFCYFLNMKRNAGEFTIKPSGYILIGQFSLEILNLCEVHQDFSIIKNIILLSQTFFYALESGEKVYLQQALRGHSIWKDLSFWNTFISDGINNELQKQNLKNLEVDKIAEQENHKSLIFCQLISFGTIMGEFGVPFENISKIVHQFTSKHKLGQNESSQILSTVSSTLSILNLTS